MLSQPEHLVHELRHVLLWPLLIAPGHFGKDAATVLATLNGSAGQASPWSLLADEFTANPDDPPSEASVVIFRRHDVAQLRLVLQEGMVPLRLDIAILIVEPIGRKLPLGDALDLLHRFGRAYPAGWDDHGKGLHHTFSAEWLKAAGEVVVASDSAHREKYLSYVCRHRAPAVAAAGRPARNRRRRKSAGPRQDRFVLASFPPLLNSFTGYPQ